MVKKKIIFYIESLSGGGAEKVLSTLLRKIDKSKFDITVCSLTDEGIYTEQIPELVSYRSIIGAPSSHSFWQRLKYRIKYKLIYSVLPAKWSYRLFMPHDYDVEVAFVEGVMTKLVAASTDKKSRKMAWVHIDLEKYPWPRELGIFKTITEEKNAYSKFDTIVGVSDTVSNSFERSYSLHAETLYNPVDETEVLAKSCQQSPINMAPKPTINLVAIGRLVYQKGFERLISVVGRLWKDGFNISLYLLGTGTLHKSLEEQILNLGLIDIVHLCGYQDNPYSVLRQADVFVSSSVAEGFSLVILEAMILGIPVVSTYTSGPNELLEEGKFGILTPNTEEGIYEGLKTVLSDPQKLTELRRLSKERAEKFKSEEAVKAIEGLLQC